MNVSVACPNDARADERSHARSAFLTIQRAFGSLVRLKSSKNVDARADNCPHFRAATAERLPNWESKSSPRSPSLW